MGSPVRGFAAVRRFGARRASEPSVAVAVVLLAEPVAGQLVAERPGGRPSPAVSQPAEPAALPVAGRLAFGLSAEHLAELPWRDVLDRPAELVAGRLVPLLCVARLTDFGLGLVAARSVGQSLAGQRLFWPPCLLCVVGSRVGASRA